METTVFFFNGEDRELAWELFDKLDRKAFGKPELALVPEGPGLSVKIRHGNPTLSDRIRRNVIRTYGDKVIIR